MMTMKFSPQSGTVLYERGTVWSTDSYLELSTELLIEY